MYDSDNDPGTPAREASDPGDPAPRPAVVTPDPAPVATPVPVAVAVPATPPVLPTQQLPSAPPRDPSDGGKACKVLGICLFAIFVLFGAHYTAMKNEVVLDFTLHRGYNVRDQRTRSPGRAAGDEARGLSPVRSYLARIETRHTRQQTYQKRLGVIPLQRQKVRPGAETKPHDRVDDASEERR